MDIDKQKFIEGYELQARTSWESSIFCFDKN
jgi:hypothetical protein